MKTQTLLQTCTAALLLGFSGVSVSGAELAVKPGDKIAFLGDSITQAGWQWPGGYVRLVADGLEKCGAKIVPIPAGVSGNKSTDMLARLERGVLAHRPDWLTLSCGVNDVWHGAKGVDLEAYKQNITAIVDRATGSGVKVVILTATPIGEDQNANNEKLAAYNDFLRALAKERQLPLADLNADFQRYLAAHPADGGAKQLTFDGVHPNSEGYVLMARGCLRAFGVADADLDRVEALWLSQPDTAGFVFTGVDSRPVQGLTLGQYRALAKLAAAKKTEVKDLGASLWLRALAAVVERHPAGEILDPNKIKQEVTRAFDEALSQNSN